MRPFILYNPDDNVLVRFPTSPNQVPVSQSATTQSIRIDDVGNINRPDGTEPIGISWEGTLYGASRQGQPFVEEWVDPLVICQQMDTWLQQQADPEVRTVLRLVVEGAGINLPVTIATWEWTPTGAYDDIGYKLALTEHRLAILREDSPSANLGSDPNDPDAANEQAGTPGNESDNPAPPATYVVQSGDFLISIAQLLLGDSTRWQEIYDLNKEAIGPDPGALPAGITLVIPGGVQEGADTP